MNKITANNMINALKPYKQYLLINEWENIVNVIEHWIEHKKLNVSYNKVKLKKEEKPLIALWNFIWNKKITLSYAIIILIIGISFSLGKYI